MTKDELKGKLMDAGIREDDYSLEGGLPNEAYCLNYQRGSLFRKGYWEVYYSERGNKSGLKLFDDEDEACAYFYTLIIESSANPANYPPRRE